ncbi:MAG: hypothetical protein LBU31_03290 [Coriobacteriales bacterium]|nr:hypothetical protein [Coriobacteriales bacterium]
MSARLASRSAIGVGLSTLVTIMVAVLLTTFSVLALVSARADLKLSNKVVESTQSYYAADSQAEQWLAELNAFVATGHPDLVERLALAGYTATTIEDGRVLVTGVFFLDTGRDLVVEVAFNSMGDRDILRWQSTPR